MKTISNFLIVLLLSASAELLSCSSPKGLKESSKHPTTPAQREAIGKILLASPDGSDLRLNSLRGKVVFINFWATWCLPCKVEMPYIDKLMKSFVGDSRIVFLTVDVENDFPSSVAYMKKKNFGLPVYAIKSGLPQGFLPNAIPVTVILKKNGDIATMEVGAVNYSKPVVKKALEQLIKE
ncbi:MAG: TlpA family protein disulfide reductase [Chitinophagaceae bacterium]|nr:TlpA family protein disulfide reductase [Chitinophagaceae bacterium]